MWVATGYDTQTYRNEIVKHLDYEDSTLIISPRQSGKTYTLFNKFLQTERSCVLAYGGTEALRYRTRLREVNRADKTGSVFASHESLNGHFYDTIFIDEPFMCNDLGLTLERARTASRRVVAIGTPTGAYRAVMFPNVIRIADILDGNKNTSIFSGKREHFTGVEDLFTV